MKQIKVSKKELKELKKVKVIYTKSFFDIVLRQLNRLAPGGFTDVKAVGKDKHYDWKDVLKDLMRGYEAMNTIVSFIYCVRHQSKNGKLPKNPRKRGKELYEAVNKAGIAFKNYFFNL